MTMTELTEGRTIARLPDPADELRCRLDRIISFLEVKRDFQGLDRAWAATVVRIARGLAGPNGEDGHADVYDEPRGYPV